MLKARVNAVEPLGSEVNAYLRPIGTEFIARLDARFAPRPDETIEVGIAPDQVHLFDPTTEQALS